MKVPDWLYVLIVASLALYLVVGGVAWVAFTTQGIPMPDAFATILATIAGGLVGILSPAGITRAGGSQRGEESAKSSVGEAE
jgi:hypothetical protein